eukprot:TRINITY_DN2461_c0_g3_i1.p1 TRINITY_DN2461_c0_g3~~TRINITY_DN2461_c0_g3_i1.p1  ORF type:complete len:109 (-),score=6.79 TRINITY_DN2461_c0_g3_i1:243-569(-)
MDSSSKPIYKFFFLVFRPDHVYYTCIFNCFSVSHGFSWISSPVFLVFLFSFFFKSRVSFDSDFLERYFQVIFSVCSNPLIAVLEIIFKLFFKLKIGSVFRGGFRICSF